MRSLRFAFAGLVLALMGSVHAQPTPSVRPNRVYVELLGNAGGASINAERAVGPRVAVRAGLGYMPGLPETTVSAVAVPVMVSWVPRGRRGVEAGVGLVFRHQTDGQYRANAFLTATVGYRWVGERGTVYRVGLTPVIGHAEGNPQAWGGVPLVGVSIGRAF